MAEPGKKRRLTSLSIQVLVIWALRCVLLPIGMLKFAPAASKPVAAPALTATSTSGVSEGWIAIVGVLTAASLAAGAAYALRVRAAWYLVQACMLVGWILGGASGNHVVFIGEAALMIYLSFSLYHREVRDEFDVHVAPRELGVLLVLVGMCAVLDLLRPRFIESENFLDLGTQFSMVSVMSVGMTMVIVLGGIDLSVGSIVALSGCLGAMAYCAGWGLPAAVVVALAVGGGVGACNGVLVSRFRMAPFIVTLGTMSMARSLSNVITKGAPIVPAAELEGVLKSIAWKDTLWVPNPVWIMALVVLAGHVFLTRTRTGRHVYYIGANEEAARLSGLNVTGVKWLVYVICGLLAGLAGIMKASWTGSGQPGSGEGDELQVIAAVIIGGASFTGGEGTVLGALVGAAIMGVLRQGLVLLGVQTLWQGFVVGAVIIGAVGLDMLRRRATKR